MSYYILTFVYQERVELYEKRADGHMTENRENFCSTVRGEDSIYRCVRAGQ